MRIRVFVLTCALFLGTTAGQCFTDGLTYEFGGQLALQYSGYYGDEDLENGFVLPDDENLVRKAAISINGTHGKYIFFEVELGSERCPSSSSDNVRVLEAKILFKPIENAYMGFSRGHILRGYHFSHDCTDLLTAEKVRWSSATAACHPTGVVAGYHMDFSKQSGLDFELSYNNGMNSNTVEDEFDFNIGVNYQSPIKGLSLMGFYTKMDTDFDLDQTMDNGKRIGLGARFDDGKFTLGSEYYFIDGAASPFDEKTSSELQMRAFYIETAYRFTFDKIISYVQPYVRYQSWDRGYNVSWDSNYEYMDFGMNVGIGGYDASFRAEYQTRIGEPDYSIDEEDKLILRLQINL